MPVKAMSKSMILHDSHLFLDISLFRLVPSTIQTAGPKPPAGSDDVATTRQGPSFKEVDSRLVAFRLIQLRLANGVTYLSVRGSTKQHPGSFFFWMDVFWRCCCYTPENEGRTSGKKQPMNESTSSPIKKLGDFPLVMLVFGRVLRGWREFFQKGTWMKHGMWHFKAIYSRMFFFWGGLYG